MAKSSTKPRIPLSIAMQSLKGVSILAAQTWRRLQAAETPEQENDVLVQLWELQDNQDALIDAHAELADQIDAELAAIKARMEFLIKVHAVELDRLNRWREGLDRTILQLNEAGLIGTEAVGQTRRIRIKLNPPSCAVLNLEQVPEEFITTTPKKLSSAEPIRRRLQPHGAKAFLFQVHRSIAAAKWCMKLLQPVWNA